MKKNKSPNAKYAKWIHQTYIAANNFQQILSANVLPSAQTMKLNRGWLLQIDRNPKHSFKSEKK